MGTSSSKSAQLANDPGGASRNAPFFQDEGISLSRDSEPVAAATNHSRTTKNSDNIDLYDRHATDNSKQQPKPLRRKLSRLISVKKESGLESSVDPSAQFIPNSSNELPNRRQPNRLQKDRVIGKDFQPPNRSLRSPTLDPLKEAPISSLNLPQRTDTFPQLPSRDPPTSRATIPLQESSQWATPHQKVPKRRPVAKRGAQAASSSRQKSSTPSLHQDTQGDGRLAEAIQPEENLSSDSGYHMREPVREDPFYSDSPPSVALPYRNQKTANHILKKRDKTSLRPRHRKKGSERDKSLKNGSGDVTDTQKKFWDWDGDNDKRIAMKMQEEENDHLLALQMEQEDIRERMAPKMRDCAVCSESIPIADLPALMNCTHLPQTCPSCYASWIENQLNDNGWRDINCPETNCKEKLEHIEVKQYSTPEIFQKYDALSAREVLNDNPNFRWCRGPNCISGQIHIGGADDDIFTCNECSFELCVKHDVPWHKGETCKEYDYRTSGQKEKDQQVQEQASKAAIKQLTKTCPGAGCSWPIEKNLGCDHMTCFKCKYEFCWLCLADYNAIRKKGNSEHKSDCRYHA